MSVRKAPKKEVKKRLSKEEIQQRKDHAKLLYLSGVTNQRELSKRVGISVTTINGWINDEHWERLRESHLVTKEAEKNRMFRQLTSLNDQIEQRPPNEQYANTKEADILVKLTAAIRQFESDTSIAEVVDVGTKVIEFIQKDDPELARTVTAYIDSFIHQLIR